ncbi:MAG: MFS transporter [Chloroflexi bacterium]|nr:MFS transporter [Chloroflexota bacterium]
MKPQPRRIQTVYLSLTLLNTLAASFIWGINTLFLLDAGLTNTEAFAANAFFTAGQVLFEVPTGVVADVWGRRTSYLLGTLTLALSTLFYLLAWQLRAPFGLWAVTSVLLGLGFTFFSGATEAWLVDALRFTGFTGSLDTVFARGQSIGGVAMLVGSVSGGLVAQATSLGVPYLLRAGVLGLTFVVAFVFMKDLGFTPQRGQRPLQTMQQLLTTSVNLGLRNPSLRWVMLAAPFTVGVSFYAFYAMQPYLLQLYGDSAAYGVAGLAAAIVAGAQIAGGLAVPYLRRLFRRRTSVLLLSVVVGGLFLAGIGLTTSFPLAVLFLVVWALMFAAQMPVRQAYMNALIPSQQRATVLSFDSLLGSSGGVVIQPALGRVADVWGYPTSYLASAAVQLLAAPLLLLARRQRSEADPIDTPQELHVPSL